MGKIRSDGITLTKMERRILAILWRNRGTYISSESFLTRFGVGNSTLKSHICHLRKKLTEMGCPDNLIIGSPFLGYRIGKEKKCPLCGNDT